MKQAPLNIFGITFTNDYYRHLNEITDRIVGPRLWFPQGNVVDYPDIGDWSQRVYSELKNESKRAIIAIFGLKLAKIVGTIIYQRHKTNKDWLELKHLSVNPEYAGRLIASFLLRQAEVEGLREFGSQAIVCDVKAVRTDVCRFLLTNHYQSQGVADLYGRHSGPDVVFKKEAAPALPKIKCRKIILAT